MLCTATGLCREQVYRDNVATNDAFMRLDTLRAITILDTKVCSDRARSVADKRVDFGKGVFGEKVVEEIVESLDENFGWSYV